ncbi:MAG: hypothetical protein DRO40_07155 [Thermoprotei archaeon]|nr:MAG: hypothetical protein DRO40_07155 [Thermoprotei archaeon]
MRLRKQLSIVEKYYELYVSIYTKYLSGEESIYAMERVSELLIQALLDLAAMMASMEKTVKPSTYRELARYLASKIGLNSEHRIFLEGLAGFRNILVHGYASIDRDLEEKAFSEIKEILPTIIDALKSHVKDDPCLEDVVEGIRTVASKWRNIDYIVLFGSIARSGCGRDIDLAVKGRFRSALELGRLVIELADELNIDPEKIDLVYIDSAPIHLLKTIVDEGIIIYGDKEKALNDLYRIYLRILDEVEEESAIRIKMRFQTLKE